jgi:hypothetical protein
MGDYREWSKPAELARHHRVWPLLPFAKRGANRTERNRVHEAFDRAA